MAQPTTDATIRHQVYVERYKSQVANEFLPFLKKVDGEIRALLLDGELTELSRTRLEAKLRGTRKLIAEIYDDWGAHLNDTFKNFAEFEAAHEVKTLSKAMTNPIDFNEPTPERLQAAFLAAPLSVRGVDGGKLLEPFIKDYSKSDVDLLINTVRQGYFEGNTNAQISKGIRGTVSANYKDGTLGQVNRHARAIVRTSVQHISSTARHEVWENNRDLVIGFEVSATLDGRTSAICRGLDGRVFLFKDGGGPRPPYHIGCRSADIPVLSDKYSYLDEGGTRAARNPTTGKTTSIPANETYYSWLKRQPKDFIDDTIGVTQSKLLRNGGLTGEQFSRLQLNSKFEPLTLDAMRAKADRMFPTAFDQAGI